MLYANLFGEVSPPGYPPPITAVSHRPPSACLEQQVFRWVLVITITPLGLSKLILGGKGLQPLLGNLICTGWRKMVSSRMPQKPNIISVKSRMRSWQGSDSKQVPLYGTS